MPKPMVAKPPIKQGARVPAVQGLITRNQGPESEQSLTFTTLTTQSTASPLRTDRKIQMYQLQFMGTLTNPASGTTTLRTNTSATASSGGLIGTQLFDLIQFVTLRGQHSVFGTQSPIYVRGKTLVELMTLYYPNYTPSWWVASGANQAAANAAALVKGAALDVVNSHVNNVVFILPIPLYPLGAAASDIASYCINGPDWAGNLYLDVQMADASVIYSTASATWPVFSAYQSANGSPSVAINSIRPLLTAALASRIVPAINFYTTYFSQPTTTVNSQGGTGVKITDLTVGRDCCRVVLKVGTVTTAPTGNLSVYDTLSDTICTRTYIALDSHPIPNRNANTDFALSDFQGLMTGRSQTPGWRIIDFIETVGASSVANPKASLPASTLTAARKFELDADTASAAGQVAEVVQEMLLGQPGWRQAA